MVKHRLIENGGDVEEGEGLVREKDLKNHLEAEPEKGKPSGNKQGKEKQEEKKPEKPNINFDNAFFYNEDGSFNVDKGKDAYIALMKYHGYPVFEGSFRLTFQTYLKESNFV